MINDEQIKAMDETAAVAVGDLRVTMVPSPEDSILQSESEIELHVEELPMPPIVIYHGNCADGFCAALAFWLKHGNAMEYYPGVYQEAPPNVEGRIVYMVDFSYKRDVVLEMLEKAEKVYFIDHHKTAIEDLADLSDIGSEFLQPNFMAYTDLNRSGAMLAWDFVYNTVWNGFGFERNRVNLEPEYREAPKLFHYVQDRDLWQKKLPRTNEFSANLFSYNYDFVEWAGIMSDVESVAGFTHFCMAGEAILRKQQKDINELLKVTLRYFPLAHEGDGVPTANMPYTLASEACHQLLQDHPEAPFAACYWDTETHRIFSLRSEEGREDVSEIAKLYGGGGHRNAAGFRVTRDNPLAQM